MEALKFTTVSASVETNRIYPLTSLKSVVHTVAKNGSETLALGFGERTEILRDAKDIKKVLSAIKSTEANKNANEVQQKQLAEQLRKAADIKAAKEEAKAEQERKSAEIKKALEKRLKKGKKKVAAKVEKKVTKKKVTKKTKKTKRKAII